MEGLVEKCLKGILNRRNLIYVVIFWVAIGSFTTYSYGEEDGKMRWGFSLSTGIDQKSRNDLGVYAFLPRLGLALHKNWDLEFEGNFSYYAISDSKNLYLLGLNTNILFKPF